ncbi:Creatinase/aminopeptidase [Thamnocephalis sphaerospora]|uniref:Creatinase/aminopeptidase n=1 Tax=Thamnocephalis sphaerospora TaxID=78915 RepID=A0A4P9XTE7_9FUNG|nr:Creatinase/aminopeptidase [Thamnocephalis sphaerospora]|eukprot:RKP09433.1 Creatinase/aminopeptidase [Thamnocephalis sphaerospora]
MSGIETADLKRVNTTERLQRLRTLMASPQHNLSAYVIPSEDAHQSEYIAACDARRAFISGFSGSAGCAVVTTDQAALFTDGRYFLQASQQLDSNWTLMKQGLPDVPTWQEFVIKVAGKNGRVGMDPTLITAPEARTLQAQLAQEGASFVQVKENLVDAVWDERPARPENPVFELPLRYSGRTMADKISDLRAELAKSRTTGVILSALDEIAWLFNLRGSDIQFNPVFFAYALVTEKEVILFINDQRLTADAREHLGNDVQLKPYSAVFEHMSTLAVDLASAGKKLMLTNRASAALEEAIGKDNIVEARSPIMMAKAVKNDTELEGMRQSHLRDAAALCEYFAWLENELASGNTSLNEVDVADKLESLRAQQADFKGLSFDTISGSGPNGAIIHYKPERDTCAIVSREHMYLCDSGGQYMDGTTDVTRTFHFGTPTEHEKRCFTRVLQGHIAIDRAVFPSGTTGFALDILARSPLWQEGLDYRHGTGHGVGSFLNVHEGPQGIGYRPYCQEAPLLPGMTVTNEPGYYEDGAFGIRIENVLLVRKVDTPNDFGGKGYLGFENVTMVPIHKKLIAIELLSPVERQWVDDFHRRCFERVGPRLEKGSLAYQWLERETSPL